MYGYSLYLQDQYRDDVRKLLYKKINTCLEILLKNRNSTVLMTKQLGSIAAYFRSHEYVLLIFFTILTLILYPYMESHTYGVLWYHLLISGILISGIMSTGNKKTLIGATVLIGLLSLVLNRADFFAGSDSQVLLLYLIVTLLFFVLVFVQVIYSIFGHESVHRYLVYGAIAGYLMIGMAGSFAFAIIELLIPGSFAPVASSIGNIPSFLYYSFVSMLTIGYGDMIPVGGAAQMRSVMLAIIGQLYLTIVLGIVIGKFVRRK